MPIRCLHFTAPVALCRHNDAVRALNPTRPFNPEKRALLPATAFSSFAARYHAPTTAEGFQDVTDVNFYFDGTNEQRRVWGKYWI